MASTDSLVVVHVIDKNRDVRKDFLCRKGDILKHMAYFRTHLTQPREGDTEVDITVHCDARVFEWLVNYISEAEPRPRISSGSVISLLVSSEFLEMDDLRKDCLAYMRDHFRSVIKIPLDLACLSDVIVGGLSDVTEDKQLITFKDPRDKISSRLYRLRLQKQLQTPEWKIVHCRHCDALYSEPLRAQDTCLSTGNAHEANPTWSFTACLAALRKSGVSWRDVYWWIWSLSLSLECQSCGAFTYPARLVGERVRADASSPLQCPQCSEDFSGTIRSPSDPEKDEASWLNDVQDIRSTLITMGELTKRAQAVTGVERGYVLDVGGSLSLDTVDELAKGVVMAPVSAVPARSRSPGATKPGAGSTPASTRPLPQPSPTGLPRTTSPLKAPREPSKRPPEPLHPAASMSESERLKSMPIVALSLDDMMNYKATLTGGAVAAAAQLAHLTSSSKQKAGVSQSRQREWQIDQLRTDDELRLDHLKKILVSHRWPDASSQRPSTFVDLSAPVTRFGK